MTLVTVDLSQQAAFVTVAVKLEDSAAFWRYRNATGRVAPEMPSAP